ncbi:MAG: YfhO family protein [Ruminococcus sp.]|nr:YfhO family protein [Ruminococcus sp.]
MSNVKIKSNDTSKEKYLLAFLLGFGCIMLTLLPIMIAERGYFIFYGDFNAQQIPFYSLANDAAKSGNFGWNWFTDLGADFMTSYSFYLFGSPFFRLSSLLPRGLAVHAIPVLLAVKHGVASVTAYAYIRRFVRNKDAAVVGGMLYAFSGFQLFNIFFNHFQDVTALFPLMLIAMEENINCRRKGVFALIVAVMAINNYYFFTGQAVFLVLYYLFRMVCPDFNTSWKKFFGLAFEAILGTAMAAFVLLPSAMAIMGNYRVSEHLFGMDMVLYSDKTLIPRIIQTFFMIPDAPARPNLFDSDYEKWASIGGFLPLFSMTGVITFIGSQKKSWATRFLGFCIFCSFIPILNSFFQAANSYYYARWFYMPILIMAMMTAQSLDDTEADNLRGWRITAVITAVFAVIGLLPKKKDDKLILFQLPARVGYFWIQIGIAALCLIGTYYIYKRKSRRKTFLKLSVLLTAAASLICTYTLILYGAYSLDSANEYIDTVIKGGDKVWEQVDEDNFFRVDISEDCDNFPMVWKLPTMRAFQSVVTTSIMDFYEYVGVHRDVASRADISHYTLRGLLSVKYYYKEIIDDVTYYRLISGDYSIPEDYDEKKNTDYTIIPDELEGFKYVGKNGRFEIYENELYIPMGFGYDTYVTREDADALSKSAREKIMMDSLIFEDSDHEKKYSFMDECTIKEKGKTTKEDYVRFCQEKRENCSSSFRFDNHSFTSEISLEKPMMVFFSVPYSEGWTAEVNGKAVDVERVNEGFMAVACESGDNTIVFRYKTPYLNIGALISLAGIGILCLYLAVCYVNRDKGDKRRHTHFYDYSTSDRIKACEVYNNSFASRE